MCILTAATEQTNEQKANCGPHLWIDDSTLFGQCRDMCISDPACQMIQLCVIGGYGCKAFDCLDTEKSSGYMVYTFPKTSGIIRFDQNELGRPHFYLYYIFA